MAESVKRLRAAPNTELIWASPRELLNIFQADEIGCQVITVTNDIIKKLSLVGKDMNEYSLETVKMFYEDGKAAGYKAGESFRIVHLDRPPEPPKAAEGVGAKRAARPARAAAGKRGVQRRSATSTRAPTKRTPSRRKRSR